MKRRFFVLATAFAVGGTSPVTAAPATKAPVTDSAPFGCNARAPNVCYFRIFYTRGDRIVILPAGMKAKVPGVAIGSDQYCMTLNETPVFKCARKGIDGKYNS